MHILPNILRSKCNQTITFGQLIEYNMRNFLIFCMIFEGKYFCCNILWADQISLFCCPFFARYWAICVLQLFLSHNLFHNILRLFDILPSFRFTTVKWSSIISNKHGIYDLSHELPNDLKLRILEISKIHGIIT